MNSTPSFSVHNPARETTRCRVFDERTAQSLAVFSCFVGEPMFADIVVLAYFVT